VGGGEKERSENQTIRRKRKKYAYPTQRRKISGAKKGIELPKKRLHDYLYETRRKEKKKQWKKKCKKALNRS